VKVGITRDEVKAREFINLAKSIGIEVIPLDIIRLVPKNEEIDRLRKELDNNYDYILFMSPNTIDMLNDDIFNKLNNKTVISIGPKTKGVLEMHKVKVKLMPKEYSSYGIIRLFKNMDSKGKMVLIVRSTFADNFLTNELRRLGIIVNEIRFYDIIPNYNDISKFINGIECIVFTSASNVHSFFKIINNLDDNIKVIAIGPFTANALKRYNINPIVAQEHTIEGIFKELKRVLGYE